MFTEYYSTSLVKATSAKRSTKRITRLTLGKAIVAITQIVFQTLILEIGSDYVALENKVPPEYISQVRRSQSFGLQCKMVRFTAPRIDSDGENILFPLKELKMLPETRAAERFPFEAEEQVVCEILNPYDNETVLSKTVLDMSATGLSIRLAKPSKLFQPGTMIERLKVMIAGEAYRKTSASVVYSRKLMDLKGKLRVQVGLKLTDETK